MKKIYTILVCIWLLAGFVACEKDKDFALTTLTVQNETITPSYGSATISCAFKADATISEAFVQYSLLSSFAKYDVAKMTEEKGKYATQLTGLADNTTYYIRYAVSNKYSSAVTEEVIEFQTLQCTAPAVILDSIADVWDNHAKAYIHLTFYGGASVTDMGVCWGTQANPTIEDIHKSTKDTVAVLDIPSLQPNTQYYVRAYAVNKVGVAYSEEKEFTTYALPEVRTEDVSDIQVNSALLSATLVFDGNDTATVKGFCWSDKAEPTIDGNHITVDTTSAHYTYVLSKLLLATEYHVRAYAQNKIGVVYGEEKTFTTSSEIALPTVTTAIVTQITETSAVASGNVTSDGGASVSERGVVYSISANPAITDLSSTIVRSGNGTGAFTCNLSNLQAGTTYYVRAYAINNKGTAYGDEVSFTTAVPITLATVTTASITNITETTAKAGGTVTNDGNAAVTERGVCISTLSNPTTSNTKISAGLGTGAFTCNLTGLQANTTYYVRAYAVNSKGTAYGEQVSFTTSKTVVLPSVTTSTVTQITQTTAVAGGNVTSDGGASVTEKGVVYGKSPNPTISNLSNTIRPCGSGIGEFTYNMTDLQPSTTYYVRAYATNEKGTAYGEEVSFTTKEQSSTEPVVTETITVNGVSFTMVAVEGGTFTMGATSEQGSDATSRESPTHSVTLSDFAIGETEVTQELWKSVMGSNPSYFSGTNLPVEMVSWNDCQTFISKLNNLTGKNFRLPTEAEWEYAARGGNKSKGYKYAGSNTLGDVAWYDANSSSMTHPVKQKLPNELGLYDMSGNVWEWCQDWFGSYNSSAKTNPTGPTSGYVRMDRGGSWVSIASFCRVSNRDTGSPTNTYNYLGLRLALGAAVELEVALPTVTTSAVSQITETTAVAGGNVTSDGNATVTERGVVYSTKQDPTISDNKKLNGSGVGSFVCDLTNLQPNTTYYVRAYAVNSMGTAYGSQVSFTTKEQSSTPNNGTENGYSYVDLGLSVKWATCNVGANNPEDYGDYFAWGETTTKATYDWSTYKYCNGSSSTLTKYCNKSSYGNNGFTDNKTQLELSDDAAYVNWGGAWRMPSDAEWTELREQCTWTWTTQNGVYGRKVTSKTNGNSIFLPAAGWRNDTSLYGAGSSGDCWSSSLDTDNPILAWYAYFDSGYVYRIYNYRYYGRSVRPVCP